MTHDRAEQIFGQLNERMDAEPDKAEKFLAEVFSFEGVKRAGGTYYTPKETVAVVDAALGTGAYLVCDDNAAPCLPPDFVDNDHDGMS